MIHIHVVAQTAFVFDLSDVRALRKLGITGVLVGTLPRAPQQNVFLGLPLQLSVYEACWLVANGHAQFVDGLLYNENVARRLESPRDQSDLVYAVTPDIFHPPKEKRAERAEDKHNGGPQGSIQREDTQQGEKLPDLGDIQVSEDIKTFVAGQEVNETSPSANGDEEESKEVGEANEIGGETNEVEGKSNEIERESNVIEGESNEIKRECNEAGRESSELNSSVGELEPKVSQMHLVELEDGSHSASGHSIVLETEIEPFTLSLSQYLDRQTLPEAFDAKYSAFSRLRSLQYYMMPGLRFGGVFVAYPGDPLQFHSHLIVKVLQKNESVDLLELVTSGRLATAVKKAWVLMGEDTVEKSTPEKQPTQPLPPTPIRAFSIEWAGFG